MSAAAPAGDAPPTGAESVEAVPVAFDLTRTTLFADLMLELRLFRIVGEVGQVSGGDVETYNHFTGSPADDSRLYGSIGLRFGR